MKQTIRINSIFNGNAPSQYFGGEGTFNSSLAIDPDYPISAANVKASGFAVPIGYSKFSSATVNTDVIAIINDPKDTLTYAVLTNGRLISYNSALGAETNIGTVAGGTARGAFYYNNFIYITGTGASTDDVSRYGPLNGAAVLTNNIWKGATLGTLTALTDTAYPALRGVTLPNHWGHVHGDGSAYFCDFINGQGLIHRINTKLSGGIEGNVNGTTVPSAYNVLDLPFGYFPVDISSFGTDLAILAIQTIDTTINQGDAALFLWDPTNTDTFYRGPIPLSDPIATSILNVNGILHIWSGNANSGVRMSRYVGGDSIQEVVYQEEGTPPLQGATASKGDRIVWGGWTTYPATSSSVFSINSKNARLSSGAPIHNIVKTTSAGATPTTTALSFVQQSSNVQPKLVVAWRDAADRGIDQFSSAATLTSVIRWMFNIGKGYDVQRMRIPLAGSVGANTSITVKFFMDDLSSNKTLTVINNANFSGKRKVIFRTPELVGVVGNNNVLMEFTWGLTDPLPVALPIEIDIEIKEDEI